MGAMYFMGTREGKSKTTGNPYWAVLLFRFNRFGNWEVAQSFLDQDMYHQIVSMGLPVGQPVTATVDIDGQIAALQIDRSYAALNLNHKLNLAGKEGA